jgi:Lanthionine synthetase C-like protein
VLYRPEAFEPLTDEPWDERQVRTAIREIVADTDAAYGGDELWPAAEWDGYGAALPLKNLYAGAAGVVWALDALQKRGNAETQIDLADAAARTLAAWRREPDFVSGYELPSRPQSALLAGETGILAVAWRLAPSGELADDLLARVSENLDNEANEMMWGVGGTMHAARAMAAWTGEERWREAWRESADTLWAARDPDGLWTQQLFGRTYRSIGAPHGTAGNTHALLRGGDLLAADRRETLTRDTGDVIARTAVVEDGLANWPTAEGRDLVGADGEIRVQWCGGSPGIVVAAADYLDEELLVSAAELTWRAGPHGSEKGPCICHGTAGNGYAFLKVFARTGDELWLERARRFAMHALGQVKQRGHGRYSLWTGDLGAAVYAADCLDGRSAYPVLDSWD